MKIFRTATSTLSTVALLCHLLLASYCFAQQQPQTSPVTTIAYALAQQEAQASTNIYIPGDRVSCGYSTVSGTAEKSSEQAAKNQALANARNFGFSNFQVACLENPGATPSQVSGSPVLYTCTETTGVLGWVFGVRFWECTAFLRVKCRC